LKPLKSQRKGIVLPHLFLYLHISFSNNYPHIPYLYADFEITHTIFFFGLIVSVATIDFGLSATTPRPKQDKCFKRRKMPV